MSRIYSEKVWWSKGAQVCGWSMLGRKQAHEGIIGFRACSFPLLVVPLVFFHFQKYVRIVLTRATIEVFIIIIVWHF